MLNQGNSMNFGMADIYPNLGFYTTRSLTVPEAEDQNTLVDDQKLAEAQKVTHNPASSKSILISIAIFIVVMVLLAWKS